MRGALCHPQPIEGLDVKGIGAVGDEKRVVVVWKRVAMESALGEGGKKKNKKQKRSSNKHKKRYAFHIKKMRAKEI